MIVFGSIAVAVAALVAVKLVIDWVSGGGLPPVHELPEKPLRAPAPAVETSAPAPGELLTDGPCAHRYAFFGSLGRRCVYCTAPASEDTQFIWPEQSKRGGA